MMKFRFLAVLHLPLIISCDPAPTDISREVKRAQEALAAGEYEKAYAEYSRVEREHHNPLAQFSLAMFHENGWGRPVDRPEACRWYAKAAAGDIPAAAHFHAECLAEGVHAPADPAEAARWYQRAADIGHHASLCALGELYMQGSGVPQDPARGLELCEESAAQGSAPSMLRLGRFYLEEDGIRDAAAARHWLGAAAQYDSAPAQTLLAGLLRDGEGGARDPLAARELFEAAAGKGYRDAYFPTAQLYFDAPPDPETGTWRAEDLAKTYLWLSAAAQGAADPDQRAEAGDLLAQVREVMPAAWAPELDAKVAAHFATHAAAAPH